MVNNNKKDNFPTLLRIVINHKSMDVRNASRLWKSTSFSWVRLLIIDDSYNSCLLKRSAIVVMLWAVVGLNSFIEIAQTNILNLWILGHAYSKSIDDSYYSFLLKRSAVVVMFWAVVGLNSFLEINALPLLLGHYYSCNIFE